MADLTKKCKTCKTVKNINDFPIHSKNDLKIYYRTECIICNAIYRDKYRKSNHKIKIYQKLYKKKHYSENKEQYRIYQKEYLSEKRRIDPSIKIRENISRSINSHLKSYNSNKNGESCLKHLSYSVQELKLYLESLFEPWMNWSNYGKYDTNLWDDNNISTWTWQIDHIIPHSNFYYLSMTDENFKKCWALENLRPYSAKQNLLDGVTRVRHIKC